MDQETIQKLAAEIVRHLPSYSWGLLAIQLGLTLLAAGAGAFFAEYFKTRGKSFATKADFESLLEHFVRTLNWLKQSKLKSDRRIGQSANGETFAELNSKNS
jgi:hypothetical protein